MASICARDLVVDSDLFNTKVGENTYKIDEILELLHKNSSEFKSNATGDCVSKINVTEISDGKGLLSKVYRLDLTFDKSGKKMDIVVKIPTGQIETHAGKENGHSNLDFNEHSVECNIYELLKGKQIAGMPQVYYTEKASPKRPGIIIMENLANTCDTLNLQTSATSDQCWSLLRLIAKIQAKVMSEKGIEWKGRFKDRCHTDIFYDTFIASFLPLLVEQHPEFKPLVKEMQCIICKDFGRYALVDRPSQLNATSFCQGDMWFNNVFIEKSKDGSLTGNVKYIVDWQLAHEGNPMFDFSRFMAIACDADVRREVQPKAANKFYDMLIEEYAALGHSNFKPPYSREELQELFDLAYLQESVLFLVGPPFVSVNPTNRNDSAEVLEAKVEKMKLRVRLNTQDAIKLIKKYNFADKFKACLGVPMNFV